ncbi:interleukin-12 subunit alpha [Osmerus mordax]|uniref:interleukin-12 subunit alpha n=1 Tax=Osmerus mordax TaxID=8014 RepID=UPI003510453C
MIVHADTTVFLLALSLSLSTGIPVRSPRSLDADKCAALSLLSKTLLEKTKELLNNNNPSLFSGFNCLNQALEMNSNTQTALACSPTTGQGKVCMGGRITSFNENECLGNITMDLGHYSREMTILQEKNSDLLHVHQDALAALNTIQELLQAVSSCFWTDNTFDNRLCMCKKLRGFQARLVTISRACGYISSGDHRK